MILDIIIIAIFVIAVIRGKVSGFLETVIRLLALAGALIVGVVGTKPLSEFLYSTRLDERIIDHLNEIAQDGIIDFSQYIPDVLADTFNSFEEMSLRITVLHFTSVAITTFAFMLIVVAVWLVAIILILALKKSRKQKGIIGSVDSSVGLLLGAIKGVVLVFLFLGFMFPITGIFVPDKLEALHQTLDSSFIAGTLYNINPLLIFMKNLTL